MISPEDILPTVYFNIPVITMYAPPEEAAIRETITFVERFVTSRYAAYYDTLGYNVKIGYEVQFIGEYDDIGNNPQLLTWICYKIEPLKKG